MSRSTGKLVVLFLSLMVLGGCATTHTMPVPEAQRVTKPAPGKALVYFVRPSNFGWAIHSTVYDGTQYIGTVPAETHVAYQAAPGEHMFMIIGENADFMKADLAEGKTYYAQVVARMGAWKARFSLVPSNGQHPKSQLDQWIASTQQVVDNDDARAAAAASEPEVMELRQAYMPKWEAKPDDQKQILKKESGT